MSVLIEDIILSQMKLALETEHQSTSGPKLLTTIPASLQCRATISPPVKWRFAEEPIVARF